MSTIRLTKTPELARILAEIKAFYPLLDDAEIIKMIISKYYLDLRVLPRRQATPEEEKLIAEGKKALKQGKIYKVVAPDQEIDLDFL